MCSVNFSVSPGQVLTMLLFLCSSSEKMNPQNILALPVAHQRTLNLLYKPISY